MNEAVLYTPPPIGLLGGVGMQTVSGVAFAQRRVDVKFTRPFLFHQYLNTYFKDCTCT